MLQEIFRIRQPLHRAGSRLSRPILYAQEQTNDWLRDGDGKGRELRAPERSP